MSDLSTFAAECEENMSAMETGLLALEHSPRDEELIGAVFRSAHNIKGTSKIMGFMEVGEIAHVLEEALQRYRDGRLKIDSGHVTFLLRGVDVLRERVARSLAEAGEGGPIEHEEVDDTQSDASESAAAEGGQAPAGKTLRVDLGRLDGVVKLLGEIVISRRGMESLLNGEDENWHGVLEAHRKAERLYSDMRDLVMRLRMVAMGPVLGGFRRTVRDVASASGKKAKLVIEGGDVEIDANLVESLRDPLMHMVRNSVDHGIEAPEERAAVGKSPCGKVSLRAWREGGSIAIEVGDDGRGLDKDKLVARARERGLLGEDDVLTDDDAHMLIFHPGFSTAAQITEISGRGVGMDVVRQNIEGMRGSVSISTTLGKGTAMTVRLPMTLAIISGFHVKIGAETFVLPLEQVVECLDAGDVMIDIGLTGRLVNFRGNMISCLEPRAIFSHGAEPSTKPCVVVVDHGGELIGVTVDKLLGESQTVVKPMGPMFEGLPLFSGATITGSGDVALILDVSNLVSGLTEQAGGMLV